MSINPQKYGSNIEAGMSYLVEHVKEGGRYGATQATILALTAIVKYAETYSPVIGSGDFVAYVNGQEASRISFKPDSDNSLTAVDFSQKLNEEFQKNPTSEAIKIDLAIENFVAPASGEGFKMNYLVEATYTSKLPNSAPDAPIKFTRTQTPWAEVTKVGDVQSMDVTIINDSELPQGMTIARLGIPSCMELDMN
mmetsp:Transcript_11765/g.18036  ORF Transcript_11765/g.18036 Transcript_11765/m.18036 type:complete len:195 (-) Transcript_11765:244-828(-)